MTQSLWMKRILQVRLVQEETAFTRVDQSGCVWALLRQNECRVAFGRGNGEQLGPQELRGSPVNIPGLPLRRKEKPSVFYGWIIVAASFSAMTVHGFAGSFGLFYRPLMDQFGWTVAEVALASSTSSVTYMLSVLPVSLTYKRLNLKLIILLGGLLMGSGLALSSQVSTLGQLCFFYGVVMGIGSSTIWVPFTSTIMKWFTRKRGVAMGIALSGSGFGSLCISPLVAHIITVYGWRTAFLVAGTSTFIVMLSAAVLMKSSPKEMGLKPYGEGLGQEPKTDERRPVEVARDFTLRKAIGRVEFWLVYILWALSMIMASVYNQQIVLFADTLGVSAIAASVALGMIGFSSILGRLTVGFLLDRIGLKRALTLSYAINLLSAILLMFAKNEYSLYVFAFIFGLSLGGRITLEVPLATGLFGLANLGAILGFFETAFGIGGVIGPYLAGYVFDLTGRYYELFLFCALLSTLLLAITVLLKPARTRARR